MNDLTVFNFEANDERTIIEQIKDAHQELGKALENNGRVDISIKKLYRLHKTAQLIGEN